MKACPESILEKNTKNVQNLRDIVNETKMYKDFEDSEDSDSEYDHYFGPYNPALYDFYESDDSMPLPGPYEDDWKASHKDE